MPSKSAWAKPTTVAHDVGIQQEKQLKSNVKQELLGFVQANTTNSEAITMQTDLIEQEVLDSLLLMDLVLFVEQCWGVKLIGHDFSPIHFRTIEELAQLIERRWLQQSA